MEAHLIEMLGMLLRWLHVIAGIAWVGSSFYFVWLDDSLDPPAPDSEAAKKGVSGELWAVHGGGFYNPQKYAVASACPGQAPLVQVGGLHRSRLSGTAHLVIVYLMRAQSMMLDPLVASITPMHAVLIGAASMLVAWVVYDILCRSPLGKRNAVLGWVVFALLTLLAWGLSRLLGGRAAYIHVGTAIGTIMAANVFFVIIPGQKRMVDAMRAGRLPDPRDGARGKQRSVHNNYFTLPVVFIMISNHYAATYAHPQAWAVLALIGGAGVLMRLFFNRRGTRGPTTGDTWSAPPSSLEPSPSGRRPASSRFPRSRVL